MKRKYVFIMMFIFSLPDIMWGLVNLLFASILYVSGMISRSEKLKLYGRNIALSVDQFIATKAMGQDPDISISMALGIAKIKNNNKTASVNKFWLLFGEFVNFLFGFQEDHIKEAIEIEEKGESTVVHLYTEFNESEDKQDLAA